MTQIHCRQARDGREQEIGPGTLGKTSTGRNRMIDRTARDCLVSALKSFMEERSTAFAFDKAISKVADSTKDQIVREVAHTLWLFYDDFKDHKIVAAKDTWDFFNRLILLLQSDAEIEHVSTGRRWSIRQAIAAVALIGFLWVAAKTGVGAHLFLCAIPFGVVSLLLAWWRKREEKGTESLERALIPFPSLASLMRVRRSMPGFCKKRYPPAIGERVIRSPLERISIAPNAVLLPLAWMMFAPVPLVFQMLPKRRMETRITSPDAR